jgi:hypothetical protein
MSAALLDSTAPGTCPIRPYCRIVGEGNGPGAAHDNTLVERLYFYEGRCGATNFTVGLGALPGLTVRCRPTISAPEQTDR